MRAILKMFLMVVLWILPGFFSVPTVATAESVKVPLNANAWTVLNYDKIPAHTLEYSPTEMKIKVQNSAAPLVHKLNVPLKVTNVRVEFTVTGEKKAETGPFDEDSVLRVGLVLAGDKTLTGPRRWVAAKWVKRLFELAPEGSGIDRIYFLNTTNRAELLNRKREHPKSELITEEIVALAQGAGPFKLQFRSESTRPVVALWLSTDGDETQSQFELSIKNLELETRD